MCIVLPELGGGPIRELPGSCLNQLHTEKRITTGTDSGACFGRFSKMSTRFDTVTEHNRKPATNELEKHLSAALSVMRRMHHHSIPAEHRLLPECAFNLELDDDNAFPKIPPVWCAASDFATLAHSILWQLCSTSSTRKHVPMPRNRVGKRLERAEPWLVDAAISR